MMPSEARERPAFDSNRYRNSPLYPGMTDGGPDCVGGSRSRLDPTSFDARCPSQILHSSRTNDTVGVCPDASFLLECVCVRSMKSSEASNLPIAAAVVDYGTADAVVIDEDPSFLEATPLVLDGPQQPEAPQFRDVPFAGLFLLQIAVMLWAGLGVAPKGYDKLGEINVTHWEEELLKDVSAQDLQDMEDFFSQAFQYASIYPLRIFLYLVLPCCLLAYAMAYLVTVALIRPCPRTMVYACLVSSFVWTALVLLGGALATGSAFFVVTTVLGLVAVGYYVRTAWKMVPFGAVNLKVALEAVSRNCGVYLVAFVLAEVGFLWVLYWFYVVVGVSAFKNDQCVQEHPAMSIDEINESGICSMPFPVLLGFMLSFYWTMTVAMVRVNMIPLDSFSIVSLTRNRTHCK